MNYKEIQKGMHSFFFFQHRLVISKQSIFTNLVYNMLELYPFMFFKAFWAVIIRKIMLLIFKCI